MVLLAIGLRPFNFTEKSNVTVIPEGGLAIARYWIGITAAPAEKLKGDKESGQCQARGAVVLRFGKREPVGGVSLHKAHKQILEQAHKIHAPFCTAENGCPRVFNRLSSAAVMAHDLYMSFIQLIAGQVRAFF